MTRTRIVRWLRVLLPLIALAILSTMFLFSKKPDAEPDIPYAQVDAEQMAREPRIVAPHYSGVTDDGAELSLSAAEAAPGQSDGGQARDLRLDWRGQDGLTAELTAPAGAVDQGLIALSGGVRMKTSSGWSLDAPQIEAATDRSHLAAREGVAAQAPFGQITAGTMEMQPAEDGKEGASNVLNFTGGVRLIYQP